MSKAEEAAIVRACQAKAVRCVGANLGRTAELTSKIIHALHGHNAHGVLAQATGVHFSLTTFTQLSDDLAQHHTASHSVPRAGASQPLLR
jgi:hypothetical protein